MDLEIQTLGATEFPESFISPYSLLKTCLSDTVGDDGDDSPSSPSNALETGVIESIYNDDNSSLLALSKLLQERHSEPLDRSITSKLLHLSCAFDSVECTAALLAGDVGEVPLINSVDETGMTALHVAAEHHAARCVELLLRKRARTEMRTRDGRGQLALELSLSSARFDKGVAWNPDDHSIEDLVVLIGEKDLTTIRLISEKTKEVAEVACAKAVEGSAAALAALLVVAAEKINESTFEFRRPDSGSKDKCTTVYECVVWEALSLGLETTASSSPSSSSLETANDTSSEKRNILLAEIELLQLFGVVAHSPDKKVKSPLIRAVQAADDVVVALLLKANTDIDETDTEGNSALHYSLKASRASSPQETKILVRLLKHGARVSQRNKLGLTALHMAAGSGHLQAVQILLLQDPDGISYKTEMKETPLFFAVKNDHLDCVEFLLRWGANSEVLNIRRQRAIDLAKSQDMRFMLSPTNIGLMNRNLSAQPKYVSGLQDDEDYCETLLSPMDDDAASEREAKWFYAHSAEERRKVKQGTQHSRRSPISDMDLKKRIFVGGLPPLVNSASLRKFFDENFGPVEDARVLVTQTGSHTQSRGFGFVSFKDEKSVSAAIQAHYVFIMDKQVEIKSLIAKWDDCEGKNERRQPQPHVSSENQEYTLTAFEGQQIPMWLRVFKKWLPSFIRDMSKHRRDGEYALSSLKGDFRAKFGLELDHASLGYPKLSDFMKCFSDLCCTRVLPIGRSPNHMVLRPNSVRSHQTLRRLSTIKSILSGDECHSFDSTVSPGTCADADLIEKPNPSNEFAILNLSAAMAKPSDAQPMFLQLLEQDPLFHIRPWLQTEYNNTTKGNTNDEAESQIDLRQRQRQRHLVLEALARSRENPSMYFLREFDFYSNYNESVKEGKCFACDERKLLWANFPCQHLLWCVDCKAQASLAAGSLMHKCVVCDMEVEKIDLLTCNDYRRLVGQYIFNEQFPPFDPNQLRSPSTKNSPLVGN